MIAAALRRLVLLVVGVAGGTALVSLLIGVALGASADRSISLGFYIVGSFWLVTGFFVGNRGPVRTRGEGAPLLFGTRMMRWATPEEREETINMSAIYVLLGFVLILLGLAADTRHKLF
jgi:hypothetical protein